jgi:hypothetical protein
VFTITALLPVPGVFILYGIDGLILPAIILGGHSCLAFAAAAIAGISSALPPVKDVNRAVDC